MDRIETGIEELDLVLGGGLLPGSFVIITGAPGTGKTVLAQQICFAAATPERKAIYYTTLSKPHSKLLRQLQPFEFFDADAVGQRIDLIELTGLFEDEGPDRLGSVVTEIVRSCFESKPVVVVIDSSKVLNALGGENERRRAIFELSSRIALTDAVLLFVGEYSPQEMEEVFEFPIADGAIHLVNERQGAIDYRWLRVLMMRGTGYLEGTHTFDINSKGIQLYPRLEAALANHAPPPTKRISIGIDEVDELMGGGIPETDATLVVGQSGVGKTILALSLIARALEDGERCLYVSLQEDVEQLVRKAASFGWDFESGRDSGQLEIAYIPPVEIKLDAVGALLRAAMSQGRVRRVVIDGLQELVFATRETERLPGYMRALAGLFRAAGAGLMVTSETASLGPITNPFGGLSFLFHNILLLRYMERGSEVRRTVGIHKMRDSAHGKGLLQYEIGERGIVIVGPLQDMTGILGWAALRQELPEP
ncbi:MAG: AAA family ATPase [Actinomycetota bacterium]|nr:AAA family ATPase [Actinomycetota bacterium]